MVSSVYFTILCNFLPVSRFAWQFVPHYWLSLEMKRARKEMGGERERERERQTDTYTHTDTHTHTQRKGGGERKRDSKMYFSPEGPAIGYRRRQPLKGTESNETSQALSIGTGEN